ncbi:MAG: hypothetical protein H0V70_18835 [Ktedonobacteraceae bacterium]|nr:hypothetical protein [Ktedonobacteraceae bacterium]
MGTSLIHLSRYTNIIEMMRMAFTDTQPFWDPLLHLWNQKSQGNANHQPEHTAPTPSLKVRQELKKPAVQGDTGQHPMSDMITVVRQLENDVAAYVCHNELRERVRNFVLDAFLRLAGRNDVEGIIINSHSNGTVVALDILRDLPPFAARKVRGLITAGSPLRKYTNFFTWGEQMSTIPRIEQWVNFLDLKDPVADPLAPDSSWKRNTPTTGHMTGLYKTLDPVTGKIDDMFIDDREVDNLKNSCAGGLQAHNYWDNKTQFVQPVSTILKELVSTPAVSQH